MNIFDMREFSWETQNDSMENDSDAVGNSGLTLMTGYWVRCTNHSDQTHKVSMETILKKKSNSKFIILMSD